MKRIVCVLGVAVAMLWAAGSAGAATCSGGFNFSFTAPSGSNSCAHSVPAPGSFSEDTGLLLTGAPSFSVTLATTTLINPPVGINGLTLQLFDTDGTSPLSAAIPGGTPLTLTLAATSTLPYIIRIGGARMGGGGSYVINALASGGSVGVVPIPGALLLFGAGLAFLALTTGRRRHGPRKTSGHTAQRT